MTNKPNDKKYNLKEKIAEFGGDVIGFCNKESRSPINNPLITQLGKASTSVGNNYYEADDVKNKKDSRY